MQLYHFSEESGIEVFMPRVKDNRRDMPPVVWAIDEEHAFTFYFPRDCPRIVYTRNGGMSAADEKQFFGLTSSNIVVTVETGWYERIQRTTLYRYRMPEDTFQLFDACAGYYISRETVVPLEVEPMTRLLDRLMQLNIDVRFTPNLHPLRDAILASSITDFGIHRFGNAKAVSGE
ncbi:DUF6886 family protein [Paenibacillus sp. GCM10023248]|uniref:DUF6886 family protein n=1 Tax=Bacillales TaxID=1385 RepID=UPI002378506D|nr:MULTISPECIES: DUF6886 family protein [Bacillales]MDD9266401.1 hypothetical protein [Paenibacillus sp. MAHUQ-63]MDR6878526.1 hypothetical protein [Bacillus sp. 3255]